MYRSAMVSASKVVFFLSLQGKMASARILFDEMPQRDAVAWNVMLKGYVDNGRPSEAREVFDEMPFKTSVSWNSMIMAYANEKKLHMALKIFVVMPDEFKDSASWTTIIIGLARNLQIVDALQLFRRMPMEPSSESCSSMISGLQQAGLACDALKLFKEMLASGTEPMPHSFTSSLTASSELPALSTGLMIYSLVIRRGMMSNNFIANIALSMFVKSGNLDNARCLFWAMSEREVVSWNCMIMGYGQHGYGMEAIMVFHQMQKAGFRPDRITLLASIVDLWRKENSILVV